MNYDTVNESVNKSLKWDQPELPLINLNKLPSNSSKPIDYVLYYRTMINEPQDYQIKKLREEFFAKLGRRLKHKKIFEDDNSVEWEIISYRTKKPNKDFAYIEHFVLLSFPTDVLLKEAEELHFYFSLLNTNEVYNLI